MLGYRHVPVEQVDCASDRSRPAAVLAKQTVKEDLMTDVNSLATEISHTRKVGSHLVSVIFVHELISGSGVSANSEGHAGNEIDDDLDGLDLDVKHGFVTGPYGAEPYGAEGVLPDAAEHSLSKSLNLGLYHGGS